MTNNTIAKNKNEHYITIKSFLIVIILLFKCSKRELFLSLGFNLVFGGGPAVLLYLTKMIINQSTTVFSTNQHSVWSIFWSDHQLVVAAALFVIINILLDSAQTINQFIVTTLRDQFQSEVKGLIFEKISSYEDISLFENAEMLNALHLAQDNIPKIVQSVNVLTNLMTGFFVFIPIILISFSIVWWIPFVIIVSAAPSVWIQLYYEEATYGVQSAQIDTVRHMRIYEEALTGERYAKELRQYQLQKILFTRWRKLFMSAFKELLAIRRRGAYAVFAWSLLSGIGTGLPFVYVLVMTLGHHFSIGDLAMYAGLIFEVRRSLFVLIGNLGNAQTVAFAAKSLFQLLELPSGNFSTSITTIKGPYKVNEMNVLHVRNVSFSYPSSEKLSLRNINLSAKTGDLIVIVGANGAGKTTLAKLLCRLYDPSVGEITMNDQDFRSIQLDDLRSMIGVVNQDYAKWPTSLKENVGFGLLESMDNDVDILSALRDVGLLRLVDDLPNGVNTPLTKQLEGGMDLSGGQWQRVAIARAVLRHKFCKILILDEPTASIDPDTEQEIFHTFKNLAQDKITFVISHRLSLARDASKIIVLDNGEVVECGTHQELMQVNGQYARMFSLQASSYYTPN